MPETPQDVTQKIDEEIAKIGWYKPEIKLRWRGKLLLFALRHRKVGKFLLNHLEVGDCVAPDGTKYRGFKLKFFW